MNSGLTCIARVNRDIHLLSIDGNWHVIVIEIPSALCSWCRQDTNLQMLANFLRRNQCSTLMLSRLSQYKVWSDDMSRLSFALHHTKRRSLVALLVWVLLCDLWGLLASCAECCGLITYLVACWGGRLGYFRIVIFGVWIVYKKESQFQTQHISPSVRKCLFSPLRENVREKGTQKCINFIKNGYL